MADTQTTTREFVCQFNYNDGDYKSFSLPNPKTNIESTVKYSELFDLGMFTKGDKNGGAFKDVTNGRIIEKLIVKLDIGVNNT